MTIYFPGTSNTKAYYAVPVSQKKENWLQRHVLWLTQSEKPAERFGKRILLSLEICAAVVSGVGICALIHGIKFYQHHRAKMDFDRKVQKMDPPPVDLNIEMKSPTLSFNHAQEFVIHNQIIWYRLKASPDRAWKPIFFEGYPKHIPVALSVDGANLVVLDEERVVHYKKVMHEYRSRDLQNKKNAKVGHVCERLARFQSHLRDHSPTYTLVDKGDADNWKPKWFSLPVLHYPINWLKGRKLDLPPGRAWGVSHRGRYVDHYTDGTSNHPDISQKQVAAIGVTTLYHLSRDGKKITFFDPWSPAQAEISVPETPTASFVALNMSVSAATVALIGYESSPNRSGGVDKELKIKTKLTDIDVEGWNPGLKYAYFPKEKRKDDGEAVISWNDWQEHKLPPQSRLTQEITIFQTGEGNDAREIVLKGADANGVRGYFRKKMDDTEWVFQPDPLLKIPDHEFLIEHVQENKPFKSSVADYQVTAMRWPRSVDKPGNVELQWFGEASDNSTLIFRYGDQGLCLFLHRRKSFWNFLGIKNDKYDLIIPGELADNKIIKKMIPEHNPGIRNISVKLLDNSELLLSWHRFRLKLKRI